MKKDDLLQALRKAEITITAKMTVPELQALLNQHQKTLKKEKPAEEKSRLKSDPLAGMA